MLIVKCITIREEESFHIYMFHCKERKINKQEQDLRHSHTQLT